MEQVDTIMGAVACGVQHWTQFWGDPWVSGTIFMVAYFMAALLILREVGRAECRERTLWRICGALFLFQVVNTHLDAHALIYTVGRCLAHAQGWYEDRRQVQVFAVLSLAWVVLLILGVTAIWFFRAILGNLLLVMGVSVALGFTVVKGINLHGFEVYYGGTYGPFRGADLIELSGIALALLAALLRLAGRRQAAKS